MVVIVNSRLSAKRLFAEIQPRYSGDEILLDHRNQVGRSDRRKNPLKIVVERNLEHRRRSPLNNTRYKTNIRIQFPEGRQGSNQAGSAWKALLSSRKTKRTRERARKVREKTFPSLNVQFLWTGGNGISSVRDRLKGGKIFEIAKQGVRKFHGWGAIFVGWQFQSGHPLDPGNSNRVDTLWRSRERRPPSTLLRKTIHLNPLHISIPYVPLPFRYPFSRLLISFLRVQRAQSVDGTRVGEGNSREISRSITPTHSPFPRAVWKIERARKAVWRKGGGRKKMHKRGAKRPGWWSRRLYFISYAWNFWIPRVAFIAPRESIRVSVEAYILYG